MSLKEEKKSKRIIDYSYGYFVDVLMGLWGMNSFAEVDETSLQDFYHILRVLEIRDYEKMVDANYLLAPHLKEMPDVEPPSGTYLYGTKVKPKPVDIEELRERNNKKFAAARKKLLENKNG